MGLFSRAISGGQKAAKVAIKAKPPRPPRVPNVFHQPIGRVGPVGPQGRGAQRQANARVQHIASRLPAAPRPARPPKIAHPSPVQRQAARNLRVQQRAAQGKFVRQTVQSAAQSNNAARAVRLANLESPTGYDAAHAPNLSSYGTHGHPDSFDKVLEGIPKAVLGVLNLKSQYGYGATNPGAADAKGFARTVEKGNQALGKGVGMLLKGKGSTGVVSSSAVPGGKLATNAFKDVVDTPGNLAESVALTGSALAKAAHNKPADLNQLKNTALKTDPIALAAQLKFGKALNAAEQHPVNTALEVSGVKAGIGRAAGATARSGIAGGAVAKAAATDVRPGLKVFGNSQHSPVADQGRYSRDLINKGVQKLSEKHRANRNQKVGLSPDAANPVPTLANRALHPVAGSQTNAVLRKKITDTASQTVTLQKHSRASELKAHDQAMKQVPADQQHAVALIAARIIRHPATIKSDLQTFLSRVNQNPKALYRGAEQTKAETVTAAKALLSNDKFLNNPAPAFKAADHFVAAQNKRDQALVDAPTGLTSEQLDAKLVPYAVTHMHAVPSHDHFLETPTGNPITPADVRAHMQAEGVKEPGFFSQRPDQGNRYYQTPVSRGANAPRISTRGRSGAATEQGTFSIHPDTLRAQAAESATRVEAVKGFHRSFNSVGVRLTGRARTNWDVAKEAASEFGDKNGVPMVPVRLGKLTEAEAGAAVPGQGEMHSFSEALQDAFKAPAANGREEIGLMPAYAADQLKHHFAPSGPGERALQNVTSWWKAKTLLLSPHWPLVEAGDMGLRNALHGAGPMTWLRGHVIMHNLAHDTPGAGPLKTLSDMVKRNPGDSGKAAELGANFLNAGVFNTAANTARFREPGLMFKGKLNPLRAARLAGRKWNDFYGGTIVRKGVEDQNALTSLGVVARREINRTGDSLAGVMKLGGKGMEEFVKGLEGTRNQERVANGIHEVIGQWAQMSPSWRKFLVQYTPFAQWIRAGLKFTYWTLPVHHPIKTAIAASLASLTDQQRNQLGLSDPLALSKGSNPLRGFEQGGVSLKGGKIFPAAHYSFLGAAADPVGATTSSFMPFLKDPVNAAAFGIDWKGQQLKNADGTAPKPGQRLLIALNLMAENFLPGLEQAQRIREGGGTPTAGSTVFSPSVKKGSAKGTGTTVKNILAPELRTYAPQTEAKSGNPFIHHSAKKGKSGGSSSNPFVGHASSGPSSGPGGGSSNPFK